MSEIKASLTLRVSDAFFNGAQYASEGATEFFQQIEPRVVESVREKMRQGATGEERTSLQSLTIGGSNPGLVVWSNKVQAFVDEFGLPAGKAFPPFGLKSALLLWVQKVLKPTPKPLLKREAQLKKVGNRLRALPTRRQAAIDARRQLSLEKSVSFLIARAIFERGLPRPGDRLRAPFATTRAEYLPVITDGLQRVGIEVADRVNGVQR